MGAELIYENFTGPDDLQKERFEALGELYARWNASINVISRKDIERIYERHVLHSLSIAKVCAFADGTRALDVGTGGGFPGIPLAIMFPGSSFTLCDSIGKKIRVVEAVAQELGLSNIEAVNARAESVGGKFDYVVSRAVTGLPTLVEWSWNKIRKGRAGSLPNGLLCLKGGDLSQELADTGKKARIYDISDLFAGEFFETKKIVYLPR